MAFYNYAGNDGSDQPAHLYSLLRIFVASTDSLNPAKYTLEQESPDRVSDNYPTGQLPSGYLPSPRTFTHPSYIYDPQLTESANERLMIVFLIIHRK